MLVATHTWTILLLSITSHIHTVRVITKIRLTDISDISLCYIIRETSTGPVKQIAHSPDSEVLLSVMTP